MSFRYNVILITDDLHIETSIISSQPMSGLGIEAKKILANIIGWEFHPEDGETLELEDDSEYCHVITPDQYKQMSKADGE